MPGTIYRNSVEVSENAEAYTLSSYNKLASCVVDSEITAVPSLDYKTNDGISLGSNGKIYCTPYSSSTNYRPFVITVTDSGLEYEMLSLSAVSPQYWRGVGVIPASNGKLYCIPHYDTRVITIDEKTHAIATAITGIVSGAYRGATLHPNGKIYCVPWGASHVAIIDPSNDTIDTTTISAPSDTLKFYSGVLAPNGKIYFTPSYRTYVGILDVVAETLDTSTITVSAGDNKWCAGTLAHNGKIYCPPVDATTVLIIDPSDDTAEETSITGITGTTKYGDSTLAPDGKIYCCPRNSTKVLIIDPATDTAEETTLTGLSSDTEKHHCMVLAPDGKIYCPPNNGHDNVLIINPGMAKYPITPLLSPYLNG